LMMRAASGEILAFIIVGILVLPYTLTVNASVTRQNWTLIRADYNQFSSPYGTVYYYYEISKFSGYLQDGYYEWYAVYLRNMVDPVDPTSNSEGFTVAGKAGQSATGGGVGPYINDVNNVFGIANVQPSQSQTSCVTTWSGSFSVSASVSPNGPSVSAGFTLSTTWRANGVSWALRSIYPKSHWEFWQCNEPPSSAELGAAWTFEITTIYVKKYSTYPGRQTYTIEIGPAAGFRHWYQICILILCYWWWDYSVHWAQPFTISFTNS